jgi:hypothetical protein
MLLEVAAGDRDAVADATARMQQPELVLQDAAGFFIEQILLCPKSDNYRILGASCDASSETLRRHMALLMRWLHPDIVTGGMQTSGFDRSIHVNRVTKAWEAVKTGDRRGDYDRTLTAQKRREGDSGYASKKVDQAFAGSKQVPSRSPNEGRRSLHPIRLSGNGFWSQLLLLLRRH